MSNFVHDYLTRFRDAQIKYYFTEGKNYTGDDERVKRELARLEQFIINDAFYNRLFFGPPSMFSMTGGRVLGENNQVCQYAGSVYSLYEQLKAACNVRQDLEDTIKKATADARQILMLLKYRFTYNYLPQYTNLPMWKTDAFDDSVSIDDPKGWDYLPENMLGLRMGDVDSKNPATFCTYMKYKFNEGDYAYILDLIKALYEEYAEFEGSVHFTGAGFDEFLKILKKDIHFKNVSCEPYNNARHMIVRLEYYPEDYLKVDLTLLFEVYSNKIYRLMAYTCEAVDQDTTALRQKEFPKVGVQSFTTLGLDKFFEGCKEVKMPFAKRVDMFDMK